jgi:hypothetical protein
MTTTGRCDLRAAARGWSGIAVDRAALLCGLDERWEDGWDVLRGELDRLGIIEAIRSSVDPDGVRLRPTLAGVEVLTIIHRRRPPVPSGVYARSQSLPLHCCRCKPQTRCHYLRDKHERLWPASVLGLVRVRRERADRHSLESLLQALVDVVSQSTEGNDLVPHWRFSGLAAVVVQCDHEAGNVSLLIL